jgi:recombination protein RecA
MVFLNQIRQKIGMFVGNPETTTGGNALKFYASVRLDIRRVNQVKEGEEVTGSRVRTKVVKNKVAPPFRQAEFDIMYGEGISREGDLLDLAAERGLVAKSGAWYSHQDERIGQGRENAKKYLKENPALTADLDAQLRRELGLVRLSPTEAEPAK